MDARQWRLLNNLRQLITNESRKKKINYDDSFIKILSNKIFENIKKNIKNIDYQLDTNVSLIIENHFKEFSRDYFNLKAKRNLKSFIFSTGNKTAFRLYARLSLNKNNKIEAFAHGHNLQNKDKHKLWMDLLISNTYYEQSESLRNELKQYIESLPEYQNLHKINFNFVNKFNTSNYSNIAVDLNKINKPFYLAKINSFDVEKYFCCSQHRMFIKIFYATNS